MYEFWLFSANSLHVAPTHFNCSAKLHIIVQNFQCTFVQSAKSGFAASDPPEATLCRPQLSNNATPTSTAASPPPQRCIETGTVYETVLLPVLWNYQICTYYENTKLWFATKSITSFLSLTKYCWEYLSPNDFTEIQIFVRTYERKWLMVKPANSC